MSDRCKNCGAELFTAQKFCRACGAATLWGEDESAPTKMMPPTDEWSPRGSVDTAPAQQPETTPVYAPPSYYTPSIPPPAPTVQHLPPQYYTPPPTEPERKRSPWIIAVVLVAILAFGGAIVGGRILITKVREIIASMDDAELVETLPPVALNKGAALSVTSLNGSITVEAWNQPQAEIRVVKRGKTEEMLQDIPIKVDSNPDHLVIDTTTMRDGVNVSLRIRVPRELGNVKLTTTNGSIRMSDISGLIDVETMNGSISLDNVTGVARAHTTSGSISAEINSIAQNQPVSFTTTSGSITLEIQSDINANLEASTMSGSIRMDSDFGISVQRSGSSRRASGQIGAGGPTLTVTTVSGSIRIRK